MSSRKKSKDNNLRFHPEEVRKRANLRFLTIELVYTYFFPSPRK
jgi:hypothetical protein